MIYLEQIAATMCKNGMMMTAINEATGIAVIFKTRCKMWSCPECAKVNSDLWIYRTIYGAQTLMEQTGKPLSFVTLTSHEKLSPAQTVKKLPHQWDMLRKRAKRAVPGLQYLIIPERHLKPRLHLHGLFLAGLPTRWWKDNARECGLGYQAEAGALDTPAFAGFYCGKYLFKQSQDNIWAKGFHRVRTSHKWPQVPPLPTLDAVNFIPFQKHHTIQMVFKRLDSQGYRVALADDRASWAVLKDGELQPGASWLTI